MLGPPIGGALFQVIFIHIIHVRWIVIQSISLYRVRFIVYGLSVSVCVSDCISAE